MGKIDLSPETKWDFYIDSNRKKIWQKELDMLEIFIDICKKYNLKYFMIGGSLLGVIRHKGFIPWDDDIDIYMLRKDYNRFLELASNEIKSPYFLQYYKTEKGYNFGHAQIRNSNTTAIINGDEKRRFNHGIFIDIFPVDKVPDDLRIRKHFLKKISRKKELLNQYYFYYSPIWYKKIIKWFIKHVYWQIFSLDREIVKFEKLVSKYSNEETKECGSISLNVEKYIFGNDWFEDTIEADFEYMKVMIPKKYDKYLSLVYGDYMKKPENINSSMHGNVFFDTEKSYTEYMDKIEDIVKDLKS